MALLSIEPSLRPWLQETKEAESSILWKTGDRNTMNLTCGVASGLFPGLKQRCPVQPGSYLIRNHGTKWKRFTNGFLKAYYTLGTSQGSKLMGMRKCLHRSQEMSTPIPQGCRNCYNAPSTPGRGVSTGLREPRKALLRRWCLSWPWRAGLPEKMTVPAEGMVGQRPLKAGSSSCFNGIPNILRLSKSFFEVTSPTRNLPGQRHAPSEYSEGIIFILNE